MLRRITLEAGRKSPDAQFATFHTLMFWGSAFRNKSALKQSFVDADFERKLGEFTSSHTVWLFWFQQHV